ncbi:MAG: hypothetical protein NT135_01645 [Candidatus Berkelbacteria bacterium]|nr:hypothetical protein [Candidatus Berkelbacteria bacterium]
MTDDKNKMIKEPEEGYEEKGLKPSPEPPKPKLESPENNESNKDSKQTSKI